MNTQPHLQPIVAAAILDSFTHPTQLYIAARAYPAELRGLYELPGGKVEHNEPPTDALVREIHEELNVQITLGKPITQSNGKWWPLANGRVMGVWLAQIISGTPTPSTAHLDAHWEPLTPAILNLPWIPADLPIIQEILQQAHLTHNVQTSPDHRQVR